MKPFMALEPHREVLHVQQSIEVISDSNSTQLDKPNHNLEQNIPNSLEVEENDLVQTEEHQRKRMTISENRASYNEKMVQQSKKKADKKCSQFKVEDVVSIKINKVNKMTPFTPNMLIGKITEIDNHNMLEYWPSLEKSSQSFVLQDKISPLLPISLSIIRKKFPLYQLVNRPLFKMNNFLLKKNIDTSLYHCKNNI